MNNRMTFREARRAISELLIDKEDEHMLELFMALNEDIDKESEDIGFTHNQD